MNRKLCYNRSEPAVQLVEKVADLQLLASDLFATDYIHALRLLNKKVEQAEVTRVADRLIRFIQVGL